MSSCLNDSPSIRPGVWGHDWATWGGFSASPKPPDRSWSWILFYTHFTEEKGEVSIMLSSDLSEVTQLTGGTGRGSLCGHMLKGSRPDSWKGPGIRLVDLGEPRLWAQGSSCSRKDNSQKCCPLRVSGSFMGSGGSWSRCGPQGQLGLCPG